MHNTLPFAAHFDTMCSVIFNSFPLKTDMEAFMVEEKNPLERLKEMSTGLTIQKGGGLAEVLKKTLEKKSKEGYVKIKSEDLIQETGMKCKIPVCTGMIVEEFYIPYIPAQFGGENMMGPGSENVATIENKRLKSIYCNRCMVKYERIPE